MYVWMDGWMDGWMDVTTCVYILYMRVFTIQWYVCVCIYIYIYMDAQCCVRACIHCAQVHSLYFQLFACFFSCPSMEIHG